MIEWLENHEKLAGWAQFLGAILTLVVTYITAFAPAWGRRRQLRGAAHRMISHGYEVIESYHRTSSKFAPFALSVRSASLSMTNVIDEINRFPISELDDNGPRSLARQLTAIRYALTGIRLFLDDFASQLEGRNATEEEREDLAFFLDGQLAHVTALVTGAELKRPEWPAEAAI